MPHLLIALSKWDTSREGWTSTSEIADSRRFLRNNRAAAE